MRILATLALTLAASQASAHGVWLATRVCAPTVILGGPGADEA